MPGHVEGNGSVSTGAASGTGRAVAPAFALVGAALFLASDDSNYITGQVLMADGGMVLV